MTAARDETANSAGRYFDGGDAGGGINGHSVEFLVLDVQNDPAIAKQVAERIVADERQPQRDQ
jgi:ABC-type branched-subunit amino acid transport system substrate-binding protein